MILTGGIFSSLLGIWDFVESCLKRVEIRGVYCMPIEITGRESIKVEDGKHFGKIAKVESRDVKDFTYLDTYIELDDVKNSKGEAVSIKYGCPLDLTVNTKLGKLLMAFGVSKEQIASGESIDIEQILKVGTEVQLMTQEETSDRGTFARVVDGSLKPKK